MRIRNLFSIILAIYGFCFAHSSHADLCKTNNLSGWEIAWKVCDPDKIRNNLCGGVPKTGKTVLIVGMYYQTADNSSTDKMFFDGTKFKLGEGLAPSKVIGCYYAKVDVLGVIEEKLFNGVEDVEMIAMGSGDY